MSLDVYLKSETPVTITGTGIFIRDNGKTRELSLDEARERYPDADIELVQKQTDTLYHANITHNLGEMAKHAGIYPFLWRPNENGITHARQLTKPLQDGLAYLLAHRDSLEAYNDDDGWGTYDQLCDFVYGYLKACYQFPTAQVLADY